MQSIENAIENIRQKPESIRRRYMYGCVAVTMLFILGIWLLSITEGFHSAATEAPEIKDQAAQVLPKTDDTASLSGLLEKGKTLQIDDAKQQAENFFDTNLQKTTGQSSTENTPSETK